MLFNSPEFIFGFVPLVLLGFFLAARFSHAWALAWLTLASLFFYAWWNPIWLPLMLASIAFNFFAGREIGAKVVAESREMPRASASSASTASTGFARSGFAGLSSRQLMVGAIVANIVLLVYFKYAAFLFNSAAGVVGSTAHWAAGELPLGISFFTFTQIAFLVDVQQRKAADFDPVRYGLFVTYFPHLIAGPILHHKEMMPQFARADIFRFSADRLADGCVIFILGLFKKTVLADAFGGYARNAFAAASTTDLSFFEAWGAALSYTLQIYFDFSGYCDMAIGLALMIGVQLPMNFHSPYKAKNIADFWRRWHMTLSRFLRDYLYIPLGGNRLGLPRQQFNLMVTMLLGGLWHGAGWTFVIWGGLHGLYLMVFHAWRRGVDALGLGPSLRPLRPVLAPIAWLLTFIAVVVAWVFFRAADLDAALSMLRGMAGMNGALLPDQIIRFVPLLSQVADGMGKVPYLADGTVMGCVEMFLMISLGMALALGAPTVPELRNRWRYALVVPCAALALQRVLYGQASEFLYFQF
jgi:D-alanyl-lipoteichoic acid acyltransferase DltB (MBOAT superfamily)